MYSSRQIYADCDLIPAAQVIATAKLRLGLDTSEFDLYFEIEIQNYLMNFGSLGTVTVLTKPVTIEDCKIKLPRGIRRFIGIRSDFCLDDWSTVDEDTDQPNFPLYLFTRPFLLGYGNCGCFEDYFDMRDGYIYLHTDNLDGRSVSICYEGFNTADDNNLRVYAVYESCLAWKLAELFLSTNPDWYGDLYFTERKAQGFQKKYLAEKSKIRADEQRTAWKNDAVKMSAIQDRVNISDYRLFWTY